MRYVFNNDAVMAKRIQIVELLHEAGGNAREIPREEWLAEQTEVTEVNPENDTLDKKNVKL